MKRGALALAAALAVGCTGGPPTGLDGGVDGGVDAGPGPAPELHVWVPGGAEGPPGTWIDVVVTASGDLGAGGWSLSVEGLPEGIVGRFEPAEVTAAHGALLRLDVTASAAQGVVAATVVATSGGRRIEAGVPLTVIERTDLPADFALQVRPPVTIGPTGASVLSLSGSSVEYPAQVVSLAGFTGDVRLLAQNPTGTVSVAPTTVHVAPGAPAAATVTVRVTDQPPGGVIAVHRRTWHGGAGLTGGTVELAPAPGLSVLPIPRTWLQPGASASGTLTVRAWGLGTSALSVTAGTSSGVSATAGPFSSLAAPLTFTASAGAAPGPRELSFAATADGRQAQRAARVVVLGPTTALASPELLAPPLPSASGRPARALALDLVIDGAGLELGRLDSGWWLAREANGFQPELQGPERPAARIAGVLGGRVTATSTPGSVTLTETRSDVGTRSWPIPGGPTSRVALAYDAAKLLWCAATVEPGVLQARRMDATSPAAPVDVSAGLPGEVIATGPWLTAGVGPPTVAFGKDGVFRVLQWSGVTWSDLPDPGVAAGQLPLDVALAMDDAGRPVIAWLEDAAVHVRRLEGGAWVELGPVPRAPGPVPRELALLVDRWGAPILVWSEAAYEPPPFANLQGLASHVWFTRFESGAWRTPVDLQLDPEADARSLDAALAPDGKVVIAWTEDGDVVLVRGQP